MSAAIKAGSVFSILIIAFAYLYNKNLSVLFDFRLNDVLTGLMKAEEKAVVPKTKVAIGFGGCVDYFGNGIEILRQINAKPPDKPFHYDRIASLEELEQSFAYFFEHGAAAEYVKDHLNFNAFRVSF